MFLILGTTDNVMHCLKVFREEIFTDVSEAEEWKMFFVVSAAQRKIFFWLIY